MDTASCNRVVSLTKLGGLSWDPFLRMWEEVTRDRIQVYIAPRFVMMVSAGYIPENSTSLILADGTHLEVVGKLSEILEELFPE